MTQPDHLGPSLHSESSLEKRIVQAATQLDIDVSRETLERISCYVENLQKWNRTYNLTAIRNLDEILVNHIFDCMAIIPEIGALTEGKPFKLVDVGSGAGLPGLVIAAWFPQGQIVCVDSVEKKTTFIRYVAGRMRCSNVDVLHNRIESVPNMNADIVISRAFASLNLFVELAGNHVRESGWLLSMKAAQVNQDLAEFKASHSGEWVVRMIKHLAVPESVASRYLVGLQRN